jgi:adenosylcobyric acid synthase
MRPRCLLVTDIDRGGAFAHLYGTWALLPEDERAHPGLRAQQVPRRCASCWRPAPQMLQQLTGVPTVATMPMQWHHGLPEETACSTTRTAQPAPVHTRIAVVAYPRISNLDEFQPLKNVPGVRLLGAQPGRLAGADWIILPGSKATAADLAWLRAQAGPAIAACRARRPVLGICGGLQMLGEALIDPRAWTATPRPGPAAAGHVFEADKTVRHTRRAWRAGRAWAPVGRARAGYEIHHGQTAQHPPWPPRAMWRAS